jgi:hypothetical protein
MTKAGTETEAAVRSDCVARPVEDLDEDTVKAIAASAVPTSYAELDKLIQDWTP